MSNPNPNPNPKPKPNPNLTPNPNPNPNPPQPQPQPQPQPRWEVRCAPRRCALQLSPLSFTPSYRAEVGLKWHRHEQWPSELRLTGEPSVAGDYGQS